MFWIEIYEFLDKVIQGLHSSRLLFYFIYLLTYLFIYLFIVVLGGNVAEIGRS